MKRAMILTLCFLYTSFAFAVEQQVTLSVPTMNCATCPITVKKALKNIDGVISAEVSYKTKLAIVIFDDEKTGVASLVEATTNAGYPSKLELSDTNE
ncbi:mercury resistance system periplasmic binding protein MerP [Agaribacterium sp. ZY112]|uniref:mercury resistance system periplasmic binding protein MerP n=1 Tax=Agaribacterium sp. ZY112 TaxID=3233574 RepID=UPI003524C415